MKPVKLFEEFLNEEQLNESKVIAKKKFPADEHEAGEDALDWLIDTLDPLEEFEMDEDDAEQAREESPERVAYFINSLLSDHKIDTKESGNTIEIIVLKR